MSEPDDVPEAVQLIWEANETGSPLPDADMLVGAVLELHAERDNLREEVARLQKQHREDYCELEELHAAMGEPNQPVKLWVAELRADRDRLREGLREALDIAAMRGRQVDAMTGGDSNATSGGHRIAELRKLLLTIRESP